MKLTLSYTSSDKPIEHSGVPGMRWGVRRYQNKDGSLTEAGKKRYLKTEARRLTNEINSASADHAKAFASYQRHAKRLDVASRKAKNTADVWKKPLYETDAKIAKTKMSEAQTAMKKHDARIQALRTEIENTPTMTMKVGRSTTYSNYENDRTDGYSMSTRFRFADRSQSKEVSYDKYKVKPKGSYGTNRKTYTDPKRQQRMDPKVHGDYVYYDGRKMVYY